jgi:hypothetical protein
VNNTVFPHIVQPSKAREIKVKGKNKTKVHIRSYNIEFQREEILGLEMKVIWLWCLNATA